MFLLACATIIGYYINSSVQHQVAISTLGYWQWVYFLAQLQKKKESIFLVNYCPKHT